jgi:hypothetical protein
LQINRLKKGYSETADFLTPRNHAQEPHFLGLFVFINSFANQSEVNECVRQPLNWTARNLPFVAVGSRCTAAVESTPNSRHGQDAENENIK